MTIKQNSTLCVLVTAAHILRLHERFEFLDSDKKGELRLVELKITLQSYKHNVLMTFQKMCCAANKLSTDTRLLLLFDSPEDFELIPELAMNPVGGRLIGAFFPSRYTSVHVSSLWTSNSTQCEKSDC